MRKMKARHLLTAALFGLGWTMGCIGPAPGAEGGRCQVDSSCDGELICLSNLCVNPGEPAAPDVTPELFSASCAGRHRFADDLKTIDLP